MPYHLTARGSGARAIGTAITTTGRIYLGIDFSGAAAPWMPRSARPSVWIARLVSDGPDALRLDDLRPVQDLPGAGAPFDRLVALLAAGGFAAGAIDAPFALPDRHMPPGGHAELLAQVAALPSAADRPFPSGAALVAMATGTATLAELKPLRATERAWRGRGLNVRSTLWNGPRGGAPFAAACLTLLARAARPVWPWRAGEGMLAETFPAAQLRAWGLPHQGYAAPAQRAARAAIVAGLAGRLTMSDDQRATMLASADALDAVVAGFAAIAAEARGLPDAPPADGLIAVMDDVPPAPPEEEGEQFEELLRRPGVRIERIVSRGHVTPADRPYVQAWDEWVLLLEGRARLLLGHADERALAPGDALLIPAGVPHRVTYTADPTVWLAVHLGGP